MEKSDHFAIEHVGMSKFIGTKLIKAMPMNRADYNDYRGWELPADENGEDEGFLVEYIDGGAGNHPNHSGYVSWSPSDVFHRSYRPASSGLTFGQALEALKAGKRVSRAGWNGKGMWLSLSCNGSREVPASGFWSPHNAEFAEQRGGTAIVQPCITMKTAADEIQMGWLASQSDMLSEDWGVVD